MYDFQIKAAAQPKECVYFWVTSSIRTMGRSRFQKKWDVTINHPIIIVAMIMSSSCRDCLGDDHHHCAAAAAAAAGGTGAAHKRSGRPAPA